MFILSAFADEIDPDPVKQVEVLVEAGVRHIELRSILKTNVLDLTDLQIQELKTLFRKHNVRLSAIGSPIGKILITDPFEPHLERFRRAVHLCRALETPNIRVFSYYLPEGDAWPKHRAEVMRRMNVKLDIAQAAGAYLLHENEHRIYGDSPDRVVDLLETLAHPHLKAVYDPANYVFCGYDPWEGWERTKSKTGHFHIKDWVNAATRGSLAGEGQGRIPEVMADAVSRGYQGFATMEPHLLGGGPTGGVTGPELFPKAVKAFTDILDRVGATYQ